MYTVTVCGNCHTFWMYKDRPERTNCRTCGKSHQVKNLQTIYQNESSHKARAAMASLRANKQNRNEELKEAIEKYDFFNSDVETSINSEEAMRKLGINVQEVKQAGETKRSSSSTQKEIVLQAVEELNPATTPEIIDFATDKGVTADKAYEILEKLHRSATIMKSGENEFRKI